jgi:cardiolipin synthase A/B
MSVNAILHAALAHLGSIVGLVMGAVLIAVIVAQRRAPGTTFAWLLAIVLIPYIGVPLYLVFGGRKLRTSSKPRIYAHQEVAERGTIAGMLCASGAPPPRTGNAVEIHTTGEAAFATVMETLNRAARSIHVSTLIIGDDGVGAAILAVLEAKASSGVEVRLLIDGLFKFRTNGRALASLISTGAKVAWFSPVWHIPFRHRTNLRLHRKILVADGRVAIVGGMNLAVEYMGPTPLASRWRDLSLRIVGPAVADIASVFRADWAFVTGEQLATPAAESSTGSAEVQVVGSGPDAANDLLYDAFLSLIFEARRRLWIATPYFVPDEALVRGLVLAARRGVDVRIAVPARSNHWSADLAGASYLRQVAEAGGKICCYQPGMLHAKSVLVDDRIAVVGSANLDMRSMFLDYEISLFMSSQAEIATTERWFESLWPDCGLLPPARGGRIVLESVARLIGPLA